MFAVIYQSYIKPGSESVYRKAWNTVARYFVKYHGAIGSCLHRTSDGLWVVYSKWPDKKTRDAVWPGNDAPSSAFPLEIREAILTIQYCLDQKEKSLEICMEIVDDLLGTSSS